MWEIHDGRSAAAGVGDITERRQAFRHQLWCGRCRDVMRSR